MHISFGYNGNSDDWTGPDSSVHQPQGNVTEHGPGRKVNGPTWRKSSYSVGNGACVEVAVPWRKSSHSHGNGNCAEVAVLAAATEPGYVVGVRDSKDPDGPVLEFSPGAWAEFLDEVRDGPDELATYVAEAMADPEFAAAYEAAGQEDIPTNQEDNSGVPLDELAKRERGATFSSCI